MPRSTDRRGSQRRHDHLVFVFHYLQRHVRLETVDLSRDGALLESPVLFPSGTVMVLEYFTGTPGEAGVRILTRVARVTRSFRGHSSSCGLGVHWIRAYTLGSPEGLREFLVEELGYPHNVMESATTTQAGVTSVTLNRLEAPPPTEEAASDKASLAAARMARFAAAQRGRYRLEVPVVYSLGNMHYKGVVVALGTSGIALVSPGALPFATAKLTIRFPLGDGPHSAKVLLFCEVELVAEPSQPGGTGAFSAKILGIDELDSPGAFKAFMKQLPSRCSVWP